MRKIALAALAAGAISVAAVAPAEAHWRGGWHGGGWGPGLGFGLAAGALAFGAAAAASMVPLTARGMVTMARVITDPAFITGHTLGADTMVLGTMADGDVQFTPAGNSKTEACAPPLRGEALRRHASARNLS